MDRKDMGANIANDEDIIRSILAAVTSAVSVPIRVADAVDIQAC